MTRRPWLVSLALFAPMLAVYAAHFLAAPEGSSATGFLQYDQFYYMANAREHFDSGAFTFLYGLPNSPFYDTPRLYVQVQSLLLGVVHHVSGWDPGLIYVGFGIVAGLAFFRVAVALYAALLPMTCTSRRLGLVCFLWGGGIFALAKGTWLGFEPASGYWFMNLGRNAYYASEAYYHLLFLGAALLLFRRRWAAAALVVAVLSWSSPFSGLQCLLVVLAWALLERIRFPSTGVPTWLVIALAILLGVHLGYYLGVLHTSAEHRILQQQWEVPAWLPMETMLAAYLPLAALAALGCLQRGGFRGALSDPRNRLLIVWLGVSLALANHELLIEPMQPLHFTRGYVWTPLFLLAAPALVALFDGCLALRRRGPRWLAIALVLGLAVADNAAWFGRHAWETEADGAIWRTSVSAETRRLFRRISDPDLAGHLVVTNSRQVGYWATVYTPLRSWLSHEFNTPNASARTRELQRFFRSGVEPARWRDAPLLVVRERRGNPGVWSRIAEHAALEPIASGNRFQLYVRGSRPTRRIDQ